MGNFGIDQITNTTPKWASGFRIVFLLTKIIVAYVAAKILFRLNLVQRLHCFNISNDPLALEFQDVLG
jgi:hypothetical protein